MSLDYLNPNPYIDAYVSHIEEDLKSPSGCSDSEELHLLALTGHLDQMEHGFADKVFDRLKANGSLPKLVTLIDHATNAEDKTAALDVVASKWGGAKAAELSREFEKTVGGVKGREDVIGLSLSIAKLEPVELREDYVDALAPYMDSKVSVDELYVKDTRFLNPQSLAVATVWGSLKDKPAAFERMGERIHVDAAINASIEEVRKKVVFSDPSIHFRTDALAAVLEGAQKSGVAMKEKVLDGALAAVDRIQASPFLTSADRDAALKPVTGSMDALRGQLETRFGKLSAFDFEKVPTIAAEITKALQGDAKTAVSKVNLALGESSPQVASRAMSTLDDPTMRRLTIALAPKLMGTRYGDDSMDAASVVGRMNGTQLNRLIDVLLNDGGRSSHQINQARVALSGLAMLVDERTSDLGDKLEVIQHLVPKLGLDRVEVRHSQDTYAATVANPESASAATLLAGLRRYPNSFDLALRSIPLGEPLKAVLTAAVEHKVHGIEGQPPNISYNLGMLKTIIDGTAQTGLTAQKRQIIQDSQALLTQVQAHVRALQSGDPSAGGRVTDRDEEPAAMAARLTQELAEVRARLDAMKESME